MARWAPVSGNWVASWLNTAPVHSVVEVWQAWQSVGKPAVVWFGLVVALNSAWWQLTQVIGVPVYCPFLWHWSQVAARWFPVSGKRVRSWLIVAPSQAVVVWQVAQVVGKAGVVCFGLVVPL